MISESAIPEALRSALVGGVALAVGGETLVLLPQRAVYWVEAETLLVADLHWGKAETFQRHGLAVPSTVVREDLDRLGRLMTRAGARRVVVLGDLIHGPHGLTDSLHALIGQWRQAFPQEMILVEGNHDRYGTKQGDGVELWEQWGIGWQSEPWCQGGLVLCHEGRVGGWTFPEVENEDGSSVLKEPGVVVCGHVHPVVRLTSRWDRVVLPCFVVQERGICLPAFSTFTGGYRVESMAGQQVFAVVEDQVVDVTPGLSV